MHTLAIITKQKEWQQAVQCSVRCYLAYTQGRVQRGASGGSSTPLSVAAPPYVILVYNSLLITLIFDDLHIQQDCTCDLSTII